MSFQAHHTPLAMAVVALLFSLSLVSCGVVGSESPAPEARFWVGCRAFKDSLTEFNNQSYAASEYLWDFGNGVTSTQVTPTVRYADTGVYIVRLVCKNSDGVSDEMLDTIQVFAPPPPSMLLDVQHLPMGEHDALWANSVATVLRYRGVEVAPCTIMGSAIGGNCCNQQCDDYGSLERIEQAMLKFGISSEQNQAPLSWESLREQIAQRRPVIAYLRNPQYYYTVVIIGYEADSTMHVIDPYFGEFTTRYEGTTIRYPQWQSPYDWLSTVYCFR